MNVRYEAGAWATFNGTAFTSEPAPGTLAAPVDDNNGGDSVSLIAASGAVMEPIAFSDHGIWPFSADGDGYSLVCIAPASPGGTANRRTSTGAGGIALGLVMGMPVPGLEASRKRGCTAPYLAGLGAGVSPDAGCRKMPQR